MTDRTLCITLSKNSDGTIRLKGSCIIAGDKWIYDRTVKAKDLFDEMSIIADEANNELGIGCAFDCE